MFGPALIGSIQPSTQTRLRLPARPWPRTRWCTKSVCKIALYSAWDLPPLHAFGNKMNHTMGALGRRGEGNWRVLFSRADSPGVGGRKAGNDLPDCQHKFSRVRRRLVSDCCHTVE